MTDPPSRGTSKKLGDKITEIREKLASVSTEVKKIAEIQQEDRPRIYRVIEHKILIQTMIQQIEMIQLMGVETRKPQPITVKPVNETP